MAIDYGANSGSNQHRHHHGASRGRILPKRARVRPVSQGQYRDVLSRLSDDEAEILKFKWGLNDGQACSASAAAEQFGLQITLIEELELKALRLISES